MRPRLDIVLSGFVCLMFATWVPAQAQTCSGPSPERWQASQDAAGRTIKAFAADKPFDQRDLDLIEAAKKACAIGDVRGVAASAEYTKLLRKELVAEAFAAADRLLAEYNASDGIITFGGEDMRKVSKFQHVAIALEVRRLASSKDSLKAPQGDRDAAAAAASRVIDTFNKAGWSASFESADLETMRRFAQAVTKK